jgi:hypothetical protein
VTEYTEYTAEETATNRKAWTDALRSGDYAQGQTYLRAGDNYCCLGVACDVAIKGGLKLKAEVLGHEDPEDEQSAIWGYGGAETLLPFAVQHWLGLGDPGGPLTEPVEQGDHAFSALWRLNDIAGYSFEQIAELIDGGKVLLSEDL